MLDLNDVFESIRAIAASAYPESGSLPWIQSIEVRELLGTEGSLGVQMQTRLDRVTEFYQWYVAERTGGKNDSEAIDAVFLKAVQKYLPKKARGSCAAPAIIPDLNDVERAIVMVFVSDQGPLKGGAIATKTIPKRPFNSAFKATLSNMVRRGILCSITRGPMQKRGYTLHPDYSNLPNTLSQD